MKRLRLLVLPVAALLTLGCMWDRDTLSDEYKHFPSTVQVIVGWFDRNPPLFYQMRLQRCEDLIRRGRASLDDYDDAGVAAIKLGKSKLALGFMDQKRARLERIGEPAKRQDDWYRYYANDGTFLVHNWYESPDRKANLSELRLAEDRIRRALAINPDAHFGRERVQLAVMEWMDQVVSLTGKGSKLSPDKEPDSLPEDIDHLNWDLHKTVKGIEGLIVLGGAWDSSDMFDALYQELLDQGKGRLGAMALLRERELWREGKRSLDPNAEDPTTEEIMGPPRDLQDWDKRQYLLLRAAADKEQERRTDFMMAKLKKGLHPDTDTTFWSGWRAAPFPGLRDKPSELMASIWLVLEGVAFLVGVIGVLLILLKLVWRGVAPHKTQAEVE